MNIALVVYAYYSRDARVRRYAESLARLGWIVDVVCLAENYSPKETTINLIKFPLSRKRLGKLWYLIEYLLFFFYSCFQLTRFSISKKYAIVHINNMPDYLVFSAIVPKILGAKVVLDMHDPMPELYMCKYHVSRDNYIVQLLTLIEKVSLFFADQVITANDEFKKIFLQRNYLRHNKILVILNCPDPRIFNPIKIGKKSRYFTLLYMGTVEERYALDIVIEAIKQSITTLPNLRFVIIPKIDKEGEYSKLLKNQINKLKLAKYVTIKNPKPLEEIAGEIGKADLGLVVEREDIYTNTIFPLKILEFIQMEIPVIATKTQILSKHLSDNMVYFLKQTTVQEISNAIVKLYSNPKLRQAQIFSAKKYLRKSNWQIEETKYHQLLENIVAN